MVGSESFFGLKVLLPKFNKNIFLFIFVIASKCSLDFQSGHIKGLLIFRLYHGHGRKRHDELNSIC